MQILIVALAVLIIVLLVIMIVLLVRLRKTTNRINNRYPAEEDPARDTKAKQTKAETSVKAEKPAKPAKTEKPAKAEKPASITDSGSKRAGKGDRGAQQFADEVTVHMQSGSPSYDDEGTVHLSSGASSWHSSADEGTVYEASAPVTGGIAPVYKTEGAVVNADATVYETGENDDEGTVYDAGFPDSDATVYEAGESADEGTVYDAGFPDSDATVYETGNVDDEGTVYEADDADGTVYESEPVDADGTVYESEPVDVDGTVYEYEPEDSTAWRQPAPERGARVALRNRNTGEAWNLALPRGRQVTVGRGRGCDVLLDEISVSGLQCVLYADASGRPVLENRSASNRTKRNGITLASPEPLAAGDEIRCGRITLDVLDVVSAQTP